MVLIDVVVSISLLVACILGFFSLWERVSGWVGENLLLDLFEIGRIIEHVQGIKVGVRLEQIIAPGSLRDVRNTRESATKSRHRSRAGRASQIALL